MVAGVLRSLLLLTFADREIQHPVAIERDPSAVVRVRLAPAVRQKDILHVDERGAVEPTAGQRGRRQSVFTRLRVRQVEQVILGEFRMEHDVEQAAQRQGFHGGHAGDWLGIEHAVLDQAKPSRTLGDQHAPIGQEREAPRIDEILRDQAHADAVRGRLEGQR